jgi:GR25 family glycosyltransferase involved in LPS biosynthesis
MDVFYINLTRRPDRRREFEDETTRCLIDAQRVNAIDMPSRPDLGCTLSHIKALSQSTADTCLVFEDDFVFEQDPHPILRYVTEEFTEWDVIMLSSNIRMSEPFNDRLVRVKYAWTASGYLVKKAYIPTLIACFKSSTTEPLDVSWQTLQQRDRWFACVPKIGKQRASYSDIQKHFVDYGV